MRLLLNEAAVCVLYQSVWLEFCTKEVPRDFQRIPKGITRITGHFSGLVIGLLPNTGTFVTLRALFLPWPGVEDLHQVLHFVGSFLSILRICGG